MVLGTGGGVVGSTDNPRSVLVPGRLRETARGGSLDHLRLRVAGLAALCLTYEIVSISTDSLVQETGDFNIFPL